MAILPPTRTVGMEDVQGRFDRLREAANESARSFRSAYTFYLIIAFYILVIVSSTHHELLFRAGNVQMPIVNVGVPVVWFFTVVPWLLLLLHFNLLIQAIFLANKVSQYVAALDRQGRSRTKKSEELGLLYPAPLAHKVADADQPGGMRRLLNVVVFVTLAVLPPAILVFAQVQFLPYQNEWLTWLHRGAVVTDIGLLWWLWPRIAAPHMAWRKWYRTRRLEALFLPQATAFVIVFSVFFADFPGGMMSNLTLSLDSWRDALGRRYDLSNRVLVDTEPAPEILAAHYRAICESGNGCDESVLAVGSPFWCEQAEPLQLKSRNLRNAILSGSTLCRPDLWGAELHGANLEGAELHGADLRGAKLHGTDLEGAKLHGADLEGAELHGAYLWDAELHGANLRGAKLHGTDLWGAELHGADLWDAELHGAYLEGAKLHGTDLWEVELHGAYLWKAELHGANLEGAELHGAYLRGAKLHGANLRRAKLHGADLRGLDLSSMLNEAEIQEVRQAVEQIRDSRTREQILKGIERIETGKTLIQPRSLKYSVLCEGGALHERLLSKESKSLDEIFTVDCTGDETETALISYYEELSAYLVGLICPDESGYIVEGIAQRRIPSRERDLPSWKRVLSVVEKKRLKTLDESDCKTLEERAGESEISDQQ